jgi:hypothetical protein
MTEPATPDPLFIVTCKSSEYEEPAKVFEKLIDHWIKSPEGQKAMGDAVHDLLGLPRKGREPDYLDGRFCPRCHNSLPLDWTEPCDVCGAATSSISFEGIIAEGDANDSTSIYRGLDREKPQGVDPLGGPEGLSGCQETE